MSIQSLASSNSNNIRNEDRVYSDKRPLGPSLPADGNIDDRARGQSPLVEPPAANLADSLPNYDLSFLDEIGQQTSDQDRDGIFNLTPSPLPFFSTIVPSTHPEPTQYLLSPSLSPGDETSCYLPPTKHTQDSSLLEIGSNTTRTSLDTPILIPRAFSSQSPSGRSCQCLVAVIFAVEEFEANCNSGNRAALDSVVAYQKEAIKCCRSMLKCSSCMGKRENLVLLVFIAEKMIAACEWIVVLYRTKDRNTRAGSVSSSLPDCLPTNRPLHRDNVEDHNFATSASSLSKTEHTNCDSTMSTSRGKSSDWRELLFGDYEISSPLEWDHLVRVLIILQLRAMMEWLADMKDMGHEVLGETQMASLAQAEIRVGELEII